MDQVDLETNLETYQAQLKQVEAALMIDEDNEELIKLKADLEEVINLTTDLVSMNSNKKENKKRLFKEDNKTEANEIKDVAISNQLYDDAEDIVPEKKTESGSATKRPASDHDDDDDDIDFEAMFNLPKRQPPSESQQHEEKSIKEDNTSTKPKDKNIKLTREEQEKRREQRKKKLVKKQQRIKEIEEQRERDKGKWQDFRNHSAKGKGKLKGLIKKSIFASPDSGIGKVGIGTCGIGGKGMTTYDNPTQYIYKK